MRSRRWLTERSENDRLDMAYPTGLEKSELTTIQLTRGYVCRLRENALGIMGVIRSRVAGATQARATKHPLCGTATARTCDEVLWPRPKDWAWRG
jgi:hypothetical protein